MARLVVALVALAVMSAGSMYWAAAQQGDASRGSVSQCPFSGSTAGVAASLSDVPSAPAPKTGQCPMMGDGDGQGCCGGKTTEGQTPPQGCPKSDGCAKQGAQPKK